MRNRTLDNVLLVYKKSLYRLYFLEKRTRPPEHWFSPVDLAKFEASHRAHEMALAAVKAVLSARGVRFHCVYRARHVDYADHDFVIAVGGDGTLIEAARAVGSQPVLGVNSDPGRSHGHFCCTDHAHFGAMLDAVLAGTARTLKLNRMALKLDDQPLPVTVMNELLVSHERQAAMSLYWLMAGNREEYQRGSGLWISTAVGSTGAIRSAGGRLLSPRSRRLQFLARELFRGGGREYLLSRGFVTPGDKLMVQSAMREGMLFLDGCHYRIPFGFGRTLEASSADCPLHLIVTGREGVCQAQQQRPCRPTENSRAPR